MFRFNKKVKIWLFYMNGKIRIQKATKLEAIYFRNGINKIMLQTNTSTAL